LITGRGVAILLFRNETWRKIYKTLIRPVVLYGSESWTLTKTDEEKLRISERILRKIYGPICENVSGELNSMMNYTVCINIQI
jgi:hypothetical protein